MRRVSIGVLFTGGFLLLCLFVPGHVASARQQTQQKLVFEGDVVLWTVAIKADKAADFDKVLEKLREGLMKSENPDRRRQAEGWKIAKMLHPLSDGNIAYVHMIDPVVPGADYTIMQTLYDEFPEERQELYELYRGAFVQNLALAQGRIAVDLSTAR